MNFILKIMAITFLSVFLFSCKEQAKSLAEGEVDSEEFRPYLGEESVYKNEAGQVVREIKFLEGDNKQMIDYYPDGTLYRVRNFKNNFQQGKTTLYHKNGNISEVQYFENGNRINIDSVFHENGALYLTYTFVDNMKQGPMHRYAKDGSIEYTAVFKEDRLVEVNGQNVERPERIDTVNPFGKYDRKGPIQNRDNNF